MGTEGNDSAGGKHIRREINDPIGISDSVHTAVRQGVDLVLAAGLAPEQLADFIASLREAVSRGTPIEEVPAAQWVPGLEAWKRDNPALFVVLVGVLGALLSVLGTWWVAQQGSDAAPTQVEVNVYQPAPRPTVEQIDEQIDRVIEDKLREYQQEPPSSERLRGGVPPWLSP
ncbi:hypothetical protein [Geodermatophilus obscurus]|uniref:hypothetical protein n=1 Tax=Geodermatophilus obscurus TaxID=1861 RepID=UPI00094469CA|nr:hypothetical protein [Geodermatophilus obscurus]